MMIKPASALRTDFKAITDYCKEFNKPVFLTEEVDQMMREVIVARKPEQAA